MATGAGSQTVDCVVIGAGVIGLAVARALAISGHEVIVVEAAGGVGTQTSSRNSEVIHAGIYYTPGSLKAQLCVAGKQALYRYCRDRGVAHRRTGKLIVATTSAEVAALHRYRAQAAANGVNDLTWLSAKEVAVLEPDIRCVGALLSPSTGIIDSHEYMLALQGDLEAAGGLVVLNSEVRRVERRAGRFEVISAGTDGPAVSCRRLVNAAGLHAQAVSRKLSGLRATSIPPAYFAKGHYYALRGRSPFRRLIYPQASGGGLGIHVTLDMAGAARFGPDVTWVDGCDYDFDDSRREAFVQAIRRYYSALDEARLQPAYTGIRPKVVAPGQPAGDFIIQGPADHGERGLVALYGIESPGLTASLAIGTRVAAMME